jgi:hypothetical protein
MKKLYYLLALIAVVFASCDPLSQTYKTLDAVPKATAISLTLTSVEYKLLPSSVYSYNTLNFKSFTDANTYVPAILTTRYPQATELATASISFNVAQSSSSVNVPDSTYTRIATTLAAADYIFPSTILNGNTVPANTTAYFTAAGAINYLNYKYPTPFANQLAVLTYLYFESGGTAATGNLTTDSFLFLNGAWTKVYTVSAAQYASVGRGTNNWFIATDVPTLTAYINTFLLNDPIVMATAKAGDIKYVSYRYLTTYQKILALTYDGTNWTLKQTLLFLKLNGTWIPDPTVYVTIPVGVSADYAYLKTTTIGSDAARANVASFGDFDIRTNGATTAWSDADLTAGLAAILLHKFAAPIAGIPYKVTYYVYNGSVVSAATKTFKFDGAAFVLQ